MSKSSSYMIENPAPAVPNHLGFPWQNGCGGHETPFLKNGKWFLYVWNSVTREHAYYSFSDDIFIPDREFAI